MPTLPDNPHFGYQFAMPGPQKRAMTNAQFAHSHIPSNLRRRLWRERYNLVVMAMLLGALPPVVAAAILATKLIPNPYSPQGDRVRRHNSLAVGALALQLSDPVRFTTLFGFTTYAEIGHVATQLQLGEIRAQDGTRASGQDALLITLHRLRTKSTWRELKAGCSVYTSFPGSKWSPTKLKSIYRATMVELNRLHGVRVSWSTYCFSPARAAVYAAAIFAKLNLPLCNWLSTIAYFVDGTHRGQARPRNSGGIDRQRVFFNGWLHKHCLGKCDTWTPFVFVYTL